MGVVMLTDAGREELTAMVTGEDVTGLPLTQVALEVSLQVITSPLAGV